jgi:RHS repeat-associated protein
LNYDVTNHLYQGISTNMYDAANRVTSVIISSDDNVSLFTYAYDKGSRLIDETNPFGQVSYSYDAANQLTQAGTLKYHYDAAGNRTTMVDDTSGTPVTAIYGTQTGNEMSSDGVWSYTYDNAGNIIEKAQSGAAWTYEYDNRNEMVVAKEWTADPYTEGGTLVQEVDYEYDFYGNCIEESVVGGMATQYLMDGWNPKMAGTIGTSRWQEWGELTCGSLTVQMHGDQVNQLFASVGSDGLAPEWQWTDAQGSVIAQADYNGSALVLLDYDAFGNVSSEVTEGNPEPVRIYQWQGQQFDTVTGLYSDRARYYDPTTGRFLTQDPTGFAAGDSNLYRYVNNDPTNETDPSGLEASLALEPLQAQSTNKFIDIYIITGKGAGPSEIQPGPTAQNETKRVFQDAMKRFAAKGTLVVQFIPLQEAQYTNKREKDQGWNKSDRVQGNTFRVYLDIADSFPAHPRYIGSGEPGTGIASIYRAGIYTYSDEHGGNWPAGKLQQFIGDVIAHEVGHHLIGGAKEHIYDPEMFIDSKGAPKIGGVFSPEAAKLFVQKLGFPLNPNGK